MLIQSTGLNGVTLFPGYFDPIKKYINRWLYKAESTIYTNILSDLDKFDFCTNIVIFIGVMT